MGVGEELCASLKKNLRNSVTETESQSIGTQKKLYWFFKLKEENISGKVKHYIQNIFFSKK